jgi:hypothetical protein
VVLIDQSQGGESECGQFLMITIERNYYFINRIILMIPANNFSVLPYSERKLNFLEPFKDDGLMF